MKIYVIMKGRFVSQDHLPAKVDREEAYREVERLEQLRKKNNEKALEARERPSKFKGESFVVPTYDEEMYWVDEKTK